MYVSLNIVRFPENASNRELVSSSLYAHLCPLNELVKYMVISLPWRRAGDPRALQQEVPEHSAANTAAVVQSHLDKLTEARRVVIADRFRITWIEMDRYIKLNEYICTYLGSEGKKDMTSSVKIPHLFDISYTNILFQHRITQFRKVRLNARQFTSECIKRT